MSFLSTSPEINGERYKKHPIFEMLDDLISFYEDLSYNVTEAPISNINFGLDLDSHILSSLGGTLNSIKFLLLQGRINDAYTLLRKYDDGILTNLYIICYINQNYHPEKLLNDNIGFQDLYVEKIMKWSREIEKFTQSNKMIEYIKEYDSLNDLNNLIDFEGVYKRIRQRCNDNVHFNSLYFVMLNDNSLYLSNYRLKELDQFMSFIQYFFIFHFVYLFSLKEEYMSSSDYIDALDCGLSPKEESLYWVAPYIQEIFDKYIKPNRMDLASYLMKHTCMKLK